ncbi:MAG: IS1182 family transposase [Balneolaceae bacterium]
MQGKKLRTTKLFYQLSLEDLVPVDHIYRTIEQQLDLRFLYKRTRRFYGKEGQQSIDPVVFFKMCLLGYLNNITGDRPLCRYCTDSIAARWFLGYDIDEPLPVHSTLSRTRALLGEAVYMEVFRQVLDLCVDQGMVSGKRQAVDSALVKANASVDSMTRTVIMEDASVYCRQVIQTNAEDTEPTEDPPPTPPSEQPPNMLSAVALPIPETPVKRKRSNKTHRSTSDPDARLARKPNKPGAMYYHAQISVDAQEGVIVAGLANYADLNDHESLVPLLNQSLANLAGHHLPLKEVLADSQYNTYPTLAQIEAAGITPYMNNPSGYKREREGFTYDASRDSYWCSEGKELRFQGVSKSRGKYANRKYASRPADCVGCPLRSQCLSGKSSYKSITHSSGKPDYDRMYERLQTDKGRRMLAKRKGIVEPVLGTLLHHNAMRKTYARGMAAASKHVMMACTAFNLRKWLKKAGKPPLKVAQIVRIATIHYFELFLPQIRYYFS